ncbi:hypothetical protein TNCV_4229931 [Trichonephila clavipes]|nr:hypothetical protein TNCV_4229931 [Trichonephila clavipes]
MTSELAPSFLSSTPHQRKEGIKAFVAQHPSKPVTVSQGDSDQNKEMKEVVQNAIEETIPKKDATLSALWTPLHNTRLLGTQHPLYSCKRGH